MLTERFEVKAVMFDLDGTLIHTAPEIAAAANGMLVDLGLPILNDDQVKGYIGNGVAVLIQRCVTAALNAMPDTAILARAAPLFFKHYSKNVTKSKPFDGVVPALQALQKKSLRLACVTNKPEAFTLPLLAESRLAQYFEIVVSGDTLPKKKPDPIQLQHICAKFGVSVIESMLVGDSATDIEAAHAAGCFIVTVPYGYNNGKLVDESQVDATITNLTELEAILV